MIIIIAGTNGSGKTTLMRRVLAQLGQPDQQDKMGQYWHQYSVIGKYDGPNCGGCDGYSWKGAADEIEDLVLREAALGRHVLLEGVIVSTWGLERLKRLVPHDLVLIQLDTPAEVCESSVNERRKIRMGEKYTPVKPDNLVSKHRCLNGMIEKRKAVGVDLRVLDRETAFSTICDLLSL